MPELLSDKRGNHHKRSSVPRQCLILHHPHQLTIFKHHGVTHVLGKNKVTANFLTLGLTHSAF